MCILRLYGDSHSFTLFAERTDMPVVSCRVKGEPRRKSSNEINSCHEISLNVSDQDWDDLPGQVRDAIAFLTKWECDIVSLLVTHEVTWAYLDFPVNSRLNDKIVGQCDHLPKELIAVAGRIGLGIEITTYSKVAFDNMESEANQ